MSGRILDANHGLQTSPIGEVLAPSVKVVSLTHRRAGELRALASVEIGGLVVVHGLQVVARVKEAAWLAWPDCRGRDGGYEHFIRPLTPELHQMVENAVLSVWLGEKDAR